MNQDIDFNRYVDSTIRALKVPNFVLLKQVFTQKRQARETELNHLILQQKQCSERGQQAALRMYFRHHPEACHAPGDYQSLIHYLADRSDT